MEKIKVDVSIALGLVPASGANIGETGVSASQYSCVCLSVTYMHAYGHAISVKTLAIYCG